MKVKETIEGKEVEIELDDALYMTREQHNVQLETTVKQRLASREKSLRKELAEDEEFVGEVLKAKGIDPTKPAKGEPDADTIARVQKDVREKELAPLQKQLADLEAEREAERQTNLINALHSALGDVNAKKGMRALLAKSLADHFGYDKESKQFAVKDGEKFVFAKEAKSDRPYKGIDEFVQEFAANKDNADWFDNASQRGPNTRATDGRTTTTSVRSRADLKTEAEKVSFVKEHGLEAFQALPQK